MSAGRTLLRGALGVGALQVASMAVTFGSAVLLARVLGEDGFGAYSYATTWNLVLLAPASLGVGPIVTRETAAGLEKGEHGRVRALRSFALRSVATGGLAVVVLGVPLVWALRGQLDPLAVGPMLLAVPGTALSAAMLVARHHLLGLREVVVAQVAESLLRPLLVLGGVGAALALGWPVDATRTTGWYVAGSALGLVFLGWRIRAATPPA
ncbi:MAG: oligosaccharide flippase family protein, partial [Myxococcota bacterium]